jgi:hypothetical protein
MVTVQQKIFSVDEGNRTMIYTGELSIAKLTFGDIIYQEFSNPKEL